MFEGVVTQKHLNLLSALLDCQVHSGESLGRSLGIGRAAVWKMIRNLQALGVSIEAVPGSGYRLTQVMDLLDASYIKMRLSQLGVAQWSDVLVYPQCESTNDAVIDQLGILNKDLVCLAEMQTKGRGRLDRVWVSPFARNLYLSCAWSRIGHVGQLSGLSLVVGIVLAEYLSDLGVSGVGLKWPNDVLVKGKKIAGILIEMRIQSHAWHQVVIGIGLNVRMLKAGAASHIDQPWTDLSAWMKPPTRNQLAADLLYRLNHALAQFSREGFEAFLPLWDRWDAFRDRSIRFCENGDHLLSAKVLGVNAQGFLQMSVNGVHRSVCVGEISLKDAD